jgi:O-Antigen ligase
MTLLPSARRLLVSPVRAVRSGTRVQSTLAVLTLASVFNPTPSYPLVFRVSAADLRFQDFLFAAFVLSLVLGPPETRRMFRRAARSTTALTAALFFAVVAASLVHVPAAARADSVTAVGKLIEFGLVGALAGLTVVSTEAFLPLLVVLGAGAAVNALISLGRAAHSDGVRGVLSLRPDGLLGPDTLATGGAVAALAALPLVGASTHRRPVAITVTVAGLLAILAGKSVLAAGAFLLGVVALHLLVGRPPRAVAIAVPVLALFTVLAARHEDVAAATRLLDSPRAAGNLVSNGGFEADATGWEVNGEHVHRIRVSAPARFLPGACEVTTPGSVIGEGIFQPQIALPRGGSYSLSAWLKAAAGSKLALRLEWLDRMRRFISVQLSVVTATGGWKWFGLSAGSPPKQAAFARPTIYTADTPQALRFYVDGMAFERRAVPTPSTRAASSDSPKYAGGSFVHRLLLFYIGTQVVLDHPLTGVGWLQGGQSRYMAAPRYERAARDVFPNIDPGLYPSRVPTNAHNAYLETAADAGVPALLAFLAFLGAAITAAVRASRRLRGPERLYAGSSGAMLVAVAFWLNSSPLFGGSLEVGLLASAAGLAVGLALKLPDSTRVSRAVDSS